MAALTLSTTTLPPAFVGEPYEASIAVRTLGTAPLALAAGTTQTGKDALPSSLAYGTTGANAGKITGTPVPGDAGIYSLSVKVSDSGGTDTLDNIAMTLKVYDSKSDRAYLEDTTVAANVARLNMG
jgi:hypothetical protein